MIGVRTNIIRVTVGVVGSVLGVEKELGKTLGRERKKLLVDQCFRIGRHNRRITTTLFTVAGNLLFPNFTYPGESVSKKS